MEKDILENNFETVYKEYKEYESFSSSTKDDILKQRESFQQRVLTSGEDDDTLSAALFDLSLKPLQSGEDLRILRDRLINVYDAYKIIIDFPEEVKEEMKLIKRPTQTYRIHNGIQEEIDKKKNESFREEAKKTHLEIISALKVK